MVAASGGIALEIGSDAVVLNEHSSIRTAWRPLDSQVRLSRGIVTGAL
ncbi:hypothetical protein [Kitasatospora sp. NPDC050543]